VGKLYKQQRFKFKRIIKFAKDLVCEYLSFQLKNA